MTAERQNVSQIEGRFERAFGHRGAYTVHPGEILPDPLARAPGTQWAADFHVEEISHRVVEATPHIRDQLRIDRGPVVLTEQLTSCGNVPLYLLVGYSPVHVEFAHYSRTVSELDGSTQIPRVAEAFHALFGLRYGGFQSVIEAVRCDDRTAGRLRIEPGSAILMREMTLFDSDSVPRHISWTHYRSELTSIATSSAAVSIPRDGESQRCG